MRWNQRSLDAAGAGVDNTHITGAGTQAMTVSYFVIYQGKPADPDAFARYYIDRHGPMVEAFPGLLSLVIQTRIPSDDPMLPQEDGPFLVTHMRFEDKAALENALMSEARLASRKDVDDFPPFEGRATYQAMEDHYHPLPGVSGPVNGNTCYFVQYRRPADDEAAFIDYYLEHHPDLLSEFQDVREISVHTPIDWRDQDFVERDDHMLINVVAFDDAAALSASLNSEVRVRLREDFHNFPTFTGQNLHTAMQRTVLKG